MQVVFGRGRNRQVFEFGSPQARSKETTEKLSWNLTQILFDRGVIPSLR
jgi:hypothetical protein